MNPANHQMHSKEFRGMERSYYAMPFAERYIWGATAGMLRVLYERIYLVMIRPVLTEIGIFLIPFAVYALFLVATRSGLFVQSSWPMHRRRAAGAGRAGAGHRQPGPARAFLRRAAEFDLRSRPYRERQARARS